MILQSSHFGIKMYILLSIMEVYTSYDFIFLKWICLIKTYAFDFYLLFSVPKD